MAVTGFEVDLVRIDDKGNQTSVYVFSAMQKGYLDSFSFVSLTLHAI